MKATRVIMLVLLFCASSLPQQHRVFAAEPLKPLVEIASAPGAASDTPTTQLLTQRCAALYGTVAKALTKSDDPTALKLSALHKVKYEKAMELAIRIEASLNGDLPAYVERMKSFVAKASDAYVDRMEDARMRYGSFLEDPVIKSDYQFCQQRF